MKAWLVLAFVVFVFGCEQALETPLPPMEVEEVVLEPFTQSEQYVIDTFYGAAIEEQDCSLERERNLLKGRLVRKTLAIDLCIRNNAMFANDVTKCTMEDEFLREWCIAEVSLANNPDYCSEVTGILYDFCILVDVNNGGDEECSDISRDDLQQYCTNQTLI